MASFNFVIVCSTLSSSAQTDTCTKRDSQGLIQGLLHFLLAWVERREDNKDLSLQQQQQCNNDGDDDDDDDDNNNNNSNNHALYATNSTSILKWASQYVK